MDSVPTFLPVHWPGLRRIFSNQYSTFKFRYTCCKNDAILFKVLLQRPPLGIGNGIDASKIGWIVALAEATLLAAFDSRTFDSGFASMSHLFRGETNEPTPSRC